MYYFDKPSSELTIAESAFLAALPNSPTLLNPSSALLAGESLGSISCCTGSISQQKDSSQEEYERAMKQPIPVVLPAMKFKAPHAVEMVYARVKDIPQLSSVKDDHRCIDLQYDVQWIVKGHLEQLKERNVTNASVDHHPQSGPARSGRCSDRRTISMMPCSERSTEPSRSDSRVPP
jgi:membrane peptidoglycan carboxypeptidase